MKRIFDFLMSFLAIIILSPVILFIAIAIKITSKGSIIFKQRRIGKDNKEFEIYKFRTMRTDTPNVPTHLLENPMTFITPIGRILRKTSLDELPQLFNILKGEMSIVGPRPALYTQHDLTELRTKYGINKLLPGLTGWAQINGRDEVPIEEKVKLDKEYMDKMSFLFDIKVMILTVVTVIKREGVKEGKIEKNINSSKTIKLD